MFLIGCNHLYNHLNLIKDKILKKSTKQYTSTTNKNAKSSTNATTTTSTLIKEEI